MTESLPQPPAKPSKVVSVGENDMVDQACSRMKEHNVGALVVNDPQGSLAGILSERDVIGLLARKQDPAVTPVADCMTPEVVTVTPDTPLDRIQHLMNSRHIRHLPVAEGGAVVGMISSRDVIVQQIQHVAAMKKAAEQVARLSTSFRTLSFDEVVGMISRDVPSLFQAGCSMLCYADGGGFHVQRCNCPCPDAFLRKRAGLDHGHQQKHPWLGQPPEACRQAHDIDSCLVIPLQAKQPAGETSEGDLTGYLCMCKLPLAKAAGPVADYKAALLQDILNVNLANARLFQKYVEARRSAGTDALTGAASRRFFESRLETECERAARYKRPFSLAIVDVDNFKQVNDRLGHLTGDKALVELSLCMCGQKRANDVLARYGGDEFILLMPETPVEQAQALLERIRRAASEITLGDGLGITISCGLTQQDPALSVSGNELIRRADISLYRAKHAGRNCIKCWDTTGDLQGENIVQGKRVRALQGHVSKLVAQSRETFTQSVWSLVKALEARDPFTHSHSENVTCYALGIADTLGLDGEETETIRRAAMIHDLGKIGLPDEVLLQTGQLSEQQRRIMEQHPLIGVRILTSIVLMEKELPLVRQHHERWDGQGYPDGLAGARIARGARILAVADAFDAITSTRAYQDARSVSEACRILAEGAGSQFDPQVAQAMLDWVGRHSSGQGASQELTVRDLLASQAAA